MAQTGRPLSPHLQVYKWQVQMATSILHRATGIINSIGSLIIVWGLASLAGGEDSFNRFKAVMGSPFGLVVLIGWSLSFFYHLCNGIRHLVQDSGRYYAVHSFIRSSWLSIIGGIVLTALVWGYVFLGAAA